MLHCFFVNCVVVNGCALNLGVTSFIGLGTPGMKKGRWKAMEYVVDKEEENQHRKKLNSE